MRRADFEHLYADEIEADLSAEARKRGVIEPPVCEAEAMWRAATISEENRQRAERIAANLAEGREEQRARCTTDHARRLARAAAGWNMALAMARRDGFEIGHRDEIAELMGRQIVKVRGQQSQTMEGDA